MKRLIVVLAAALALVPGASAGVLAGPIPYHAVTAAPVGLRAFLLRPDEPAQRYYPRTPSFAWTPVDAKGGTYDFELATSRAFNDSDVLFSYTKIAIPAVTIPHQLPWMTGLPYALWAHVRWESANGKIVTPWSDPFGFNMRWLDSDFPQQLDAPNGLIRWKPIEGATRYQVLYPDINGQGSFETTTNVADEREFYTFHNAFAISTPVHWRVRAIRYIDDKDVLKNNLPASSYGPWSPVFTKVNHAQTAGATPVPTDTVSDTWDKAGQPAHAHDLTPGFAWTPSTPVASAIGSYGSTLYRVYISTDDHCVNIVFKSPVIGSPAYAPRATNGPFALPQGTTALANWVNPPYLLDHGSEQRSWDATGAAVVSNEVPDKASTTGLASVDLWDSGWPNGRYYWTVVPVELSPYGAFDPKAGDQAIQYQDAAVPQDQCEAKPVPLGMSFGKVSQPVVTASGDLPWVSGLSPDGRVIASAAKVPQVHDSPLVAWQPAVGAQTYEVQLSRTSYPWRVTWSTTTPATSVILPLGRSAVGMWYYRVRGINPALPQGAQAMTWSKPVRVQVTGDRFVVVK